MRETSRRTLDELLYARFPGAYPAVVRSLWPLARRLSPRGRLRRWGVRIYARRGLEALNRGDVELFAILIHPEIDTTNTAELSALGGFEHRVHGRESWLANQRHWLGEWDPFRYEPHEAIDLGDDRFLVLGRVSGRARSSDLVVDSEWGVLTTISEGMVIREQNFLDRNEALEAVGLRE